MREHEKPVERAHWPTDITAGALLAITVNAFALALSQRFKLMVFVLVDGWALLVGTLTSSIQPFGGG